MGNEILKEDLKDLATRCIGIQNMLRNARYIYADQKLTGVVQKLEYMLNNFEKENENNQNKTT